MNAAFVGQALPVTVQLNQQLLTIRVPTRAIMTFYGECNLGLRVMNFKEAARHEFEEAKFLLNDASSRHTFWTTTKSAKGPDSMA